MEHLGNTWETLGEHLGIGEAGLARMLTGRFFIRS